MLCKTFKKIFKVRSFKHVSKQRTKKKERNQVSGPQAGGLGSGTNQWFPLPVERGVGAQALTCLPPRSPQASGRAVEGLSRLALYPVLRRAGSNNQTLDSILNTVVSELII